MDILNQIATIATPIVLTGVSAILVKIITPVGDALVKYVIEKIDASGITKELAKHQNEIASAKQVFYIIEEKYRITEKVEDLLVSKADMFDQLLLAKIPYLTQDNLSDLRQAIAGEFNKEKQAVITDETLKQSQVELTNTNTSLTDANATLQATNDQLASDKAVLQAKLDSINNALSSVNVTTTPIVDNVVTIINENQTLDGVTQEVVQPIADTNANVTLDNTGNIVQQ
jgi:hypothetical protein